jgi:hypothetical protein
MLRRKSGAFLLAPSVTAPYVLVSAFLAQGLGYAPSRPLVAVSWDWRSAWCFLTHNAKAAFSIA